MSFFLSLILLTTIISILLDPNMTTPKKAVMHVYKLDTGNRPPEPHHHPPTTTTKNIFIRSLGTLLRTSKTHVKNNNNNNNNNSNSINTSNKDDTKQVVLQTSRTSSLGAVVKDGRKSASVVEGGRRGAVAGRRSAENRAEMVMIDVGEVAELFQVRVLVTDMPGFMQVHAFRCVRRTLDGLDTCSPRQIAFNMKKDFDKVYGPAWHCIVGSSFGSFVTHATGCFLYFTMEKLYILVFKTKVRKNDNNSC